jgi:hypothetical protein
MRLCSKSQTLAYPIACVRAVRRIRLPTPSQAVAQQVAIGCTQENARAALPEETANIYVLAGEILDAVETVNRIAKIAFDGRAEIMAQFNKDLTLRGGKTRKETAAVEDEESQAV